MSSKTSESKAVKEALEELALATAATVSEDVQEALEKHALADCEGRRHGQRVACLHTRYKGLEYWAWCRSCKAHWRKASPHWTEL
mgnify:CR=1 FL=1